MEAKEVAGRAEVAWAVVASAVLKEEVAVAEATRGVTQVAANQVARLEAADPVEAGIAERVVASTEAASMADIVVAVKEAAEMAD